ncbi:MAG: hypothetical protein MUO64_01145 [Anaerolineales bacterium]|nr:hypothetical protein [Anaerolineales bacterium]
MKPTNPQTQGLNQQPLRAFKSIFASLSPPEIHSLKGLYQAEFTGPLWLRKAAGPCLVLAGMGGWWGKEFHQDGTSVNLVYRGGRLRPHFPIRLAAMPSLVDGKPGVTVQYPKDSPFPWPLVVDELRRLDDTTLLGLTIVNAGFLRKLAFPFLLYYQEQSHGL